MAPGSRRCGGINTHAAGAVARIWIVACRHRRENITIALDPTCSSYPKTPEEVALKIAELRAAIDTLQPASPSPDARDFEVESAQQVGLHLVMRVRYPSCADCAFEGSKVILFENCSVLDALKWRKIDPHFRERPATGWNTREAPSPSARFVPTKEGWAAALRYAEMLANASKPKVYRGKEKA